MELAHEWCEERCKEEMLNPINAQMTKDAILALQNSCQRTCIRKYINAYKYYESLIY